MSKEKTTALIPNAQEELMARLEIVNRELAMLNFETRNYSVAGEFSWSPNYGGQGINIAKTDLDTCEEIAGFLLSKAEKIEAGRHHLGTDKIDRPVPKWLGVPISNWLADCKLRTDIILHKDKKETLEGMKAQIEARLSEDAKISRLLAEIDGKLGL